MRLPASVRTMSISSSADGPWEGAERTFRPDLFSHKTVLVVGGTSGIGAAIAGSLLDAGARVAAFGRTEVQ